MTAGAGVSYVFYCSCVPVLTGVAFGSWMHSYAAGFWMTGLLFYVLALLALLLTEYEKILDKHASGSRLGVGRDT